MLCSMQRDCQLYLSSFSKPHGLVTGTGAPLNHGVGSTVVVAGLEPLYYYLYDTDTVRQRRTQYGFFRTQLISPKPFRSIEDDRPVRSFSCI